MLGEELLESAGEMAVAKRGKIVSVDIGTVAFVGGNLAWRRQGRKIHFTDVPRPVREARSQSIESKTAGEL